MALGVSKRTNKNFTLWYVFPMSSINSIKLWTSHDLPSYKARYCQKKQVQ